jgi:hypothetical protein
MRALIYSILAAYWAGCAIWYPKLPDRYAIHFDAAGRPDGWSDNPIAWFLLPAIMTLTVLLMSAIGRWSAKMPYLWNVPEKKRFLALRPEQREPIMQELVRVLDFAALYTLAVSITVQIGMYQSARAAEARLPFTFHVILWGGLIGLLAYALVTNRSVKAMILQASASP